jgi:hypothetical protein
MTKEDKMVLSILCELLNHDRRLAVDQLHLLDTETKAGTPRHRDVADSKRCARDLQWYHTIADGRHVNKIT